MEDGRFSELPTGLYGRAAVRAFAAAVGLDPHETLAACAAELPQAPDPIAELGRLRGTRVEAPAADAPHQGETVREGEILPPDWRQLASAAIDAGVIGAMELVVIGSAIALGAVRHAPGQAGAFIAVGVLLAASYHAWIGGVLGRTLGDSLTHRPIVECDRSLHLEGILARARQSATADVAFVQSASLWVVRRARETQPRERAIAALDHWRRLPVFAMFGHSGEQHRM